MCYPISVKVDLTILYFFPFIAFFNIMIVYIFSVMNIMYIKLALEKHLF